jgi:7-cyano-7-deazaguanine synthase
MQTQANRRIAIMLSGGLDSVVLAHDLKAQGHDVTALHFKFWPNHGERALAAASKVCSDLDIPLHVVELDGVAKLMCSLVPAASLATDELDTGGDEADSANEDAAPMPSAMLLLPAIAMFYAQAAGMDEVALGIIGNQADRNPGLVAMMQRVPEIVAGINPRVASLPLTAPYASLTKDEVIKRGSALGVDLGQTWSCLDATVTVPCGTCNQCRERRQSFVGAGMTDPTRYAA